MHRRSLSVVMLLCAGQVAAGEPLYVKNMSPVAGLFGLPAQRDAHTMAAGQVAVALHSSLASHYVNDGEKNEFLNLDGETLRLAAQLRVGLAEGWDLQLELPWLDHSGGDLDGFIDDWHDFWGMSDGGRSSVPRDLLDYRYQGPRNAFGLGDDASGLGDASLSLTHAFYRRGDSVASAELGYKFATGDEDDFTGSGEDDVWFALRFSGAHLTDLPLSWHGQAGYLRAGESNLVAGQQEQNFWFAGLAMDWRLAKDWSLLLQVDAHEAPLQSGIKGIGDEAALGTIGLRWRFARRWSVDLSIIEDIGVETAPDVTFQGSVRYRGGR